MSIVEPIIKAVIPVGGLGARLLPATKVLPKELLPVGRRPAVQYVVEEIRGAGVEQICFVTGRKKALIQEHFDHDPELVRYLQDQASDELLAELAYIESGLHLTYVRQSGPQGLVDALSLAQDFVGDRPFVLALGDSLISEAEPGMLLSRLLREHSQRQADVTIAAEPVAGRAARQHWLIQAVEATPAEAQVFDIADLCRRTPASDTPALAMAARFVMSPAVFSAIPRAVASRGGETHLPDVLRVLLRDGARVQGVRLAPDQQRYDIGAFPGYFRAFLEFALLDPQYGEEVREYLTGLVSGSPNLPPSW